MGFPGCKVQSVLCFLKGKTSSFLQSSLFVLIQPCLGKIIFSSCKSLFYILTICVLLCWYEVSILFLQCYRVFLFFEYRLFTGEIFFLSLYLQAVFRVYLSIYYTRLLFCLFWVCWVYGSFSDGPGHIFLLCGAPLCGVSGRYYLFGCYPGVGGGAVRVFFSWALLRWVRYD